MLYSVTANLCDGCDYVGHWEAGDFEDVNEAIKVWEDFMPPYDEVMALVEEGVEMGDDPDDYDIQVGVWDENSNEIEFWNGWY